MMASNAITSFGSLGFNKALRYLANHLKQGDVADEKLRKAVVKDLDVIKESLTSIRRKELEAAHNKLRVGLDFLKSGKEEQARKEFEKARDEAEKAFGVVPTIQDKVLANKIAIFSALYEYGNDLELASTYCTGAIWKILETKEIIKMIKVKAESGISQKFRGLFGKEERTEIIDDVFRCNWAVASYLCKIGVRFTWEKRDIGDYITIHPLYVLYKQELIYKKGGKCDCPETSKVREDATLSAIADTSTVNKKSVMVVKVLNGKIKEGVFPCSSEETYRVELTQLDEERWKLLVRNQSGNVRIECVKSCVYTDVVIRENWLLWSNYGGVYVFDLHTGEEICDIPGLYIGNWSCDKHITSYVYCYYLWP